VTIAEKRPDIALALSGGGIRAMAFHLGVLRLLAERGFLEDVHRISTVSGGSLLVGLMLQENNLCWPSSEGFLLKIYPKLREKFAARSLQWGAARQLLQPWNLRFILSRANLLASALRKEWNVSGKLADLPLAPEWSINGTTAENGKRFRFKRDDIGDYTLGYATPGNFPLASALAVSAAFPGGFGPLKLDTTMFDWRRRPWDAPPGTEEPVDIGYKSLHLYDGGVYDNLGLEPFFDAGRGKSKHADDLIVVSDAGAPLLTGFSFLAFNPFRLKRVADIMADQAHALRVRTFSHYLQQNSGRGAFLYIGTPVDACSPCKSATFATSFPTTLRRLTLTEFDRLADHGYRVAEQVEKTYGLCGKPGTTECG
jgi:NTE family protein